MANRFFVNTTEYRLCAILQENLKAQTLECCMQPIFCSVHAETNNFFNQECGSYAEKFVLKFMVKGPNAYAFIIQLFN